MLIPLHAKLPRVGLSLSMQTLPGYDRSGPSEPPVPDEETIPAEQPILDEEIRAEPSHDPTTIWSLYVFFFLTFHIRLVNPIFLMYYIPGLDVLLEHHAYFISFPSNTYIYIIFYYIPFSHYSFIFETCGFSYTTQTLYHLGGTTFFLYFF